VKQRKADQGTKKGEAKKPPGNMSLGEGGEKKRKKISQTKGRGKGKSRKKSSKWTGKKKSTNFQPKRTFRSDTGA